MAGHEDHGEHGAHSSDAPRGYGPEGHAALGGLALDANGLRFDPAETRFDPGEPTDWSFRIVDARGDAVAEYETAHGEPSHLIIVRRDLSRFQHLHPSLRADGTWNVPGLTLPDPGAYRAFVDVVVDGTPTTLGFDLFASGSGGVEPRPTATRRATADGYDVTLLAEDVSAAERCRLTFDVRRDGELVTELAEYLGALGHLVALREGDLAYLHVHPETTDPGSGRVEFGATFPTPGRYRLFLQAKPDGNLVTAAFDVRVDQ